MTSSKFNSLIDSLDAAWAAYMDPTLETQEQRDWQEAFFKVVREEFGDLTEAGVEGMKTIIFCHRMFWADSPKSYLAFFLGNIRQEVGANMQPIKETQRRNEASISDRQVVARLNHWWASGDAQQAGVKHRYWLQNVNYPFGRGSFQTTWHDNYVETRAVVLEVTGIDIPFDEDYNLMMDPLASAIGAFAMSLRGKYRGKALADFLVNGHELDYNSARNIVNGDTHNYDRVGRQCRSFEKALKAADEAVPNWLENKQSTELTTDGKPTNLPSQQPLNGEVLVMDGSSDLSQWINTMVEAAKDKDVELSIQVNLNVAVPLNFPKPI